MPFAPDLTPDVPPPPLTVAEKYALDEAYQTEDRLENDTMFVEARWKFAWDGWNGTAIQQQAVRDRFAALGPGAALAATLLGKRVEHLAEVISMLPGKDAYLSRLAALAFPITVVGDNGTPFRADGTIGEMTFPTPTDAPPA